MQHCTKVPPGEYGWSTRQHCTKVPLLLNNIHRYTVDPREQQLLSVALLKLETSLRAWDTLKSARVVSLEIYK